MGAKASNDSRSRKIRTFIACATPPRLRTVLGEVQACLKPLSMPLRWVKPENIHLTLKFLGDVPLEDSDRLEDAMKRGAADRRSFRLQAQGLGVFPNFKKPRVLWVGLGGDIPALKTLHDDLDAELASLDGAGFDRSKRPFRGHLTLARAKGRLSVSNVAEALRLCGDFDSEPFIVDRMILYKSDLKPGGAVYTPLKDAVFTHQNG